MFLMSASFYVTVIITERALLDDAAYSDLSFNGVAFFREWYLFEARRFREEIRYVLLREQ